MEIKERLEKEGIDPFGGDCMCVAGAIQKIVDPDAQNSEISCIRKDPYGRIGHCMFHWYGDDEYYDVDGKHDWEEAMGKFNNYTEECWMVDPEETEMEEEYEDEGGFREECWEYMDYNDEFAMKKYCDGKGEKAEKLLLINDPEWLRELREL